MVNSTARRWLSRDELSYKLIWSQIARFTTSPKEDSRFSPSDQQIEKAAADLGYQFAMLEETTDRVAREVEQAGRMKQQARRLSEKPNVATTTSSTMVSDWYNLPDPSERPSLTAFRSYLEWALLLARKLSLVVSHTQPGPSGDDVLVCHLVGEPNYKLKPIPS